LRGAIKVAVQIWIENIDEEDWSEQHKIWLTEIDAYFE
jgi:hypothetical protein